MRFSLLGPIQARGGDGAVLEIRGTLRRTLLAALLLHADTVVSQDRLADWLWGGEQPASAAASLYNHLMRLRQALGEGGERISAVPPGYLIHVEPGELDLQVFARRRESAARAAALGRWAAAEQEYAAALGLWRGEPLADVPALAGHPLIRRLEEDRLRATGGLIEARLNLGRPDEVIGELVALTARYPLRETFHSQLMLALYRAGRRAEALDTYLELRRALVDELGVEPSAEISELNQRILDSAEELACPASPASADAVAAPPIAGAARRQLPADTRLFTGRVPELDELLELSAAASAGTSTGAAVISALNGMAGVGKSALAIHVAHRVAALFPDGQLFVDLRGHTAGLEPRRPLEALHQLLRSLDILPRQIPEDVDECAALYRSRLAGSKTLIVLDDAAGAEQVRPLLPAAPGCLVLVTSRVMLTELDDAHAINLGVLSEADAVILMRKVAGPDRVPTGHPALDELVELCGRIPLAVRIAGARLRHHRELSIEYLVAQLKDESSRLEHLRDEDRNLVALFDTSYADLDKAEQRLFRLMGLVPGPDVDAYAAANLLGEDLRTAERLLDSLLEHNLLLQHAPGRYRFHDLLRAYARNLNMAAEDAATALDRLLDFYQYTGLAAFRRATRRARGHRRGPGPVPGLRLELPTADSAVAWLSAERASLLAAVAVEGIEPGRVIDLVAALNIVLHRQGPWSTAIELHRASVRAAREIGDGPSEAAALLELSGNLHGLGKLDKAIEMYESSLEIFRGLGDRPGEADTLHHAAFVHASTGEFALSVELDGRALAIYREYDDRPGVAAALWNMGRITQAIGDPAAASDMLTEALKIYEGLGNRHGGAAIRFELARGALACGRYRDAAEGSAQAAAVFREFGIVQDEAAALYDQSRARLAIGDLAAATQLCERALTLFREVNFRHGEALAVHQRGRILLPVGDPAGALEALTASLGIYREVGDQYGVACTQLELGRARHALGDLDAAREFLNQVLDFFRETGHSEAEAEAIVRLCELAEDASGPREALDQYRRALEVLEERRYPQNLARAHEGIARCLAPTDRSAALRHAREAVELYRSMEMWETARAEAYLAELEQGKAEADR